MPDSDGNRRGAGIEKIGGETEKTWYGIGYNEVASGGRLEMIGRASNIVEQSVVKEEAEGDKLLNLDVCKSGMKKP